MPFLRREVIQGHALEIISRSQVIQGRCKKLLAADFASQAPKDLANTISSMCSYLERVTKVIISNWSSSSDDGKKSLVTHLQDIDYKICELGSHVRYVDGARTQRLPWSVVKPFEKFAESLIPGITIMLRPQWKYNYSVVTTDIRQKYLDDLSEYEDFLPNDKVFKDFKKPFHIVAFPSIERKTILLHCLLGHEIGHLISNKYFQQPRIGQFLTDIRKKIAEILTRSGDATPDIFTLQQESERARIAWIRGLEEILSDIVGALLFGPAVLFSSLEMAIQDELDWMPNPKNSFYPPWRFRLREIQKIIEDPSQEFFPLPKSIFISEKFELIKNITGNTKDRETIEKDEVLKIVYAEIDKDIIEAKKVFSEELKEKTVKSQDLYKRLHHLIKRLDNGIPPNAFENSINDREPASMVEIINAAWFHKISWEDQIFKTDGSFNEDICKKRDIMNRLTLKAIEYADIEEKYRNEVGKPAHYGEVSL